MKKRILLKNFSSPLTTNRFELFLPTSEVFNCLLVSLEAKLSILNRCDIFLAFEIKNNSALNFYDE